MNGEKEKQMGWINGYMNGCIVGQTDGWMGGCKN